MKRFFHAAAAVLVLAAGAVLAVPNADAKGLRLFDFKPGEFANVVTGGSARYHLAYTLTNAGEEARKPAVRVELRTETDKTYGDHFDAAAAKLAADAAGRETPYQSSAQIRRSDLEGGASIDRLEQIGRIDPNADEHEVSVYVLSDPIERTTKGVFSERRVLVLKFSRAGDEYDRQDDPIRLVSSKEELEGEPTLIHGGD